MFFFLNKGFDLIENVQVLLGWQTEIFYCTISSHVDQSDRTVEVTQRAQFHGTNKLEIHASAWVSIIFQA